MLAFVLPRFPGLGPAYLKSDTGRLATLIRYLSEASASKKIYYRLVFDIDANAVSVERSGDGLEYTVEPDPALRGIRLTEGVTFDSVEVASLGRVTTGQVLVVFAPAGSIEAFTVKLKGRKEERTLTFNPYSGKVKVF